MKKLFVIFILFLSSVCMGAESTPEKAVQEFFAESLKNTVSHKEFFSVFNLESVKEQNHIDELNRKSQLLKQRRYVKSEYSSRSLNLKVSDVSYHGDGKIAQVMVRVTDINGRTKHRMYQLQQNSAGLWKMAFYIKPFPPTEVECRAALAHSIEDPMLQKKDGSQDIFISIPGKKLTLSSGKECFALAYPAGDLSVPADELSRQELWNFKVPDRAVYEDPSYQKRFDRDAAIVRELEKAGYVQLKEGIVSLEYIGFNGKNQEVKIAGMVYSFTDEGRDLLLRKAAENSPIDNERLYVGTTSVKSVDVLTHNQSDKFKYKCVFNKKFTPAGGALTGDFFELISSGMENPLTDKKRTMTVIYYFKNNSWIEAN